MKEKHSRTENNKIVRSQNVEALISLIQRNDQVTTDLLVKRSGLSYPTVFGIVQDLQEAGIVEQQGYATSTGGRQAHLYSICASYAYTFGIHVTAKWVDIALTNLKGGVIYQHRVEFSGRTVEIPGLVTGAIHLALNQVRQPKEKLLAVCICTSQAIQENLMKEKIDLCEEVHTVLGIPVEMVSDSTVQGFLDWETLSCSGIPSFLHILFGDSIRATMYLNGGEKTELQGFLSHVIVIPDGAECWCGKRGCLETYYNGKELLRQYNEARAQRNLAPLAKEEVHSRGLFRYLLSRSLTQDICAEEVLKQATDALAIMLANLMTITDEFHVVLSGLYSSNDARNFQKLRTAVLKYLSEDGREKLDLSMGLALPAESALGASKMMNDKYACQIGSHLEKTKRRTKQ